MEFYFYDLETFGIDSKTARIAQFAGVRTDADFKVRSKVMFYCKPTRDSLPDPQSCLTTGITPQLCAEKGLPEYQFIKRIIAEFSVPNSCILGYNNIRFDDEFVRFAAWRNLYDPYGWAWQGGNSRFDLLDVVRFCYALKRDNSLNWVYEKAENTEIKIPKFTLEQLAPQNGVTHKKAHDALADVFATIGLAKKIKKTQPKLFAYALKLRDKRAVASLIRPLVPILHTSRMYAPEASCTKLTTTLCYHPKYKDRAIVYNLEQDPQLLLDLSADVLEKRLYSKQKDLAAQGLERLQLKILHFNKSPMFVISERPPKSLNIDSARCLENLNFIKEHHHKIVPKILAIYEADTFTKSSDVDQQLYDGFINKKDKSLLDKIHTLDAALSGYQPDFSDSRLSRLFLYYKARNFPNSLTAEEADIWFETVQERLQEGADGYLSIGCYSEKIALLQKYYPENSALYQQLNDYADSLI